MGYTHYWSYDPEAPGFTEAFAKLQMDTLAISAFARELIPEARVGYISTDDNGKETINDNICEEGMINFNGIGPDGKNFGNYSYETFWMSVDPMGIHQGDGNYSEYIRENYEKDGCYSDFCKTAHRPYDQVVCAVLLRANELIPEFSVGSDGNWSQWRAGRDLYERIFNKEAPCPFKKGDA